MVRLTGRVHRKLVIIEYIQVLLLCINRANKETNTHAHIHTYTHAYIDTHRGRYRQTDKQTNKQNKKKEKKKKKKVSGLPCIVWSLQTSNLMDIYNPLS